MNLLELLVSIVILGFLVTGLADATRFGLRATETQASLSEGWGDLDATDRTLRRIVAEADPRLPLQGTGGTLALVSSLPILRDREADIGIGVDGQHRLLLRWTPYASGQLLGAAPAPQEVELLGGVTGLQLSYWSTQGTGAWSGSWTEKQLPGLVRVRIVFPAGDRRHWPDIVVAPMRH